MPDTSPDRTFADASDDTGIDRKTRFVTVRCSAAQREQMRELAAEKGFSIGAFIRVSLLGSAGPRSRCRPSLDREALARLLGQVGHVGANINQIAKALHITGDVRDRMELAKAVDDIALIRAQLMQALGRRTVSSPPMNAAGSLGHQG